MLRSALCIVLAGHPPADGFQHLAGRHLALVGAGRGEDTAAMPHRVITGHADHLDGVVGIGSRSLREDGERLPADRQGVPVSLCYGLDLLSRVYEIELVTYPPVRFALPQMAVIGQSRHLARVNPEHGWRERHVCLSYRAARAFCDISLRRSAGTSYLWWQPTHMGT